MATLLEIKQRIPDEVIQEVRGVKSAFARKFDYDIARMAQDVRQRQNASGRVVISRKKI